MTDAPELKPCPFCGGEAGEPWFDDGDGGSERGEVYCTGCPASTQGSHQGWMRDESDVQQSINQAITAWNTRADLAKPRVKPLEWEERRNDYWSAKGTGYQVASNGDGAWRVRLDGKVIYRRRLSFEAAKAAAQADYEARVLACLE